MALSAFELCEETFGCRGTISSKIIAFLRSAESRQMSHSDVEKLVREGAKLSRKLFQAHVDSRGPGEAAVRSEVRGVERDQERIHERGLTTVLRGNPTNVSVMEPKVR